MKRFLERSFPPGYGCKTELTAIFITLGAGVLISLFSFLSAFFAARRTLYIRRGAELILDESSVMPDFVYILGDKLLILLILAALIFVLATMIHYAYYQNGSRSIYLMRRLPNRFELHRRCLVVPLISALVFVLIAAFLLLIYYAVYMRFTPEVCLTPNQWQKLGRVFQ